MSVTQYTKVWQLLEDPERWIKGSYAVDSDRKPVGVNNPMACRWCLGGALLKVYPKIKAYNPAYKSVQNRLHGLAIAAWNDRPERTHAEVLALCKELDI